MTENTNYLSSIKLFGWQFFVPRSLHFNWIWSPSLVKITVSLSTKEEEKPITTYYQLHRQVVSKTWLYQNNQYHYVLNRIPPRSMLDLFTDISYNFHQLTTCFYVFLNYPVFMINNRSAHNYCTVNIRQNAVHGRSKSTSPHLSSGVTQLAAQADFYISFVEGYRTCRHIIWRMAELKHSFSQRRQTWQKNNHNISFILPFGWYLFVSARSMALIEYLKEYLYWLYQTTRVWF